MHNSAHLQIQHRRLQQSTCLVLQVLPLLHRGRRVVRVLLHVLQLHSEVVHAHEQPVEHLFVAHAVQRLLQVVEAEERLREDTVLPRRVARLHACAHTVGCGFGGLTRGCMRAGACCARAGAWPGGGVATDVWETAAANASGGHM